MAGVRRRSKVVVVVEVERVLALAQEVPLPAQPPGVLPREIGITRTFQSARTSQILKKRALSLSLALALFLSLSLSLSLSRGDAPR